MIWKNLKSPPLCQCFISVCYSQRYFFISCMWHSVQNLRHIETLQIRLGVTEQWWRSRDLVSSQDLIFWVSVSSQSRLSKVSVSSRSRGSKVSVSLETTLSKPQDRKEKNEKKRHKKKKSPPLGQCFVSVCYSQRYFFISCMWHSVQNLRHIETLQIRLGVTDLQISLNHPV